MADRHGCRLSLGLLVLMFALAAPAAAAPTVFESAPADPYAITVVARGDGNSDDTKAIQDAVDRAAKPGGGIVFLPSGRYRISRTVILWPGVRIFGTGPTRPVLVLKDHTPGFQRAVAYMVMFAGAPRLPSSVPFPVAGLVPPDPKILDGDQNTFHSALSNIDVEIGAGNPGAAAIRFRAAQHAILSHMDLRLGSAFAGVYLGGNVIRDVHFHGGRYGVVSEKTPASWPFLIIDSSFDGQRLAAIREHEAGLTLVNVAMRDVPVGIAIDDGYSDQLWGKGVRFERVHKAAVLISNENSPFTQIGFDNAIASDTPVFAQFRDSGRKIEGKGPTYRVATFNYGLFLPQTGAPGGYDTRAEIETLAALPPAPAPALRALPPVSEWTSARSEGAVGDGKTDDTAALQRAIDHHRTVYLPAGFYKVSDTIRLRPDTVLIGLHPSLTEIVLADNTPAYQGPGGPKAMIQTADGGDAIVSGLALFSGGINPRAASLMWRAGENSLLDDVRFMGINTLTFDQLQGLNRSMRAWDVDPARRFGGKYPSLWVTHGGGTFNGFWSPDIFSGGGFYISDTTIPGHVYQASIEHHTRTEIVLERVANWEFLAPQTEEESVESRYADSLVIRDSRNILIANYRTHRVTRSTGPVAAAVELYGSRDIRFRNVHMTAEHGYQQCDEGHCVTYLRANKYPFDNAIRDVTRGVDTRDRHFAVLDISDTLPVAAAAPGTRLRKLAGGFDAVAGAAVDGHGRLYFVDRVVQRIYSWSKEAGLNVVIDHTIDPVNLAVDASGTLMVLSSAGNEGTVYSIKPGGLPSLILPTPAGQHPSAAIAMPASWWVDGQFKDQYDPVHDHFRTPAELFAADTAVAPPKEYVSPDGSLVLPAFRTVHQGPPDFRGWRFSHGLDAYGFVVARPGEHIYVSNQARAKTYRAKLDKGGALTELKVFADRGGESVAVDAAGRVYVANGQVFVYSPNGREVDRIDVPERPLQVLIGGDADQTLYVFTNHGLYAVDLAEIAK